MSELVTSELKVRIYELFERHDKIVEEQDAYIEQLRERNKRLQAENTMLRKMQPIQLDEKGAEQFMLAAELSKCQSENIRLQAERDKAVEDIESVVNYFNPCNICNTKNDCHKLYSCPNRNYYNFVWRGTEW